VSDAIRVPWLCVITDRRRLSPQARTRRDELTGLEQFLADAIDAGVDLIQVRERDLDARLLVGLLTRAIERAAGSAVRILVNDRADVALAARAHGVHVPGHGPPTADVRALGPVGWTVGRSVHAIDECQAERAADYLLYGTVFESGSKPGGREQGLEGLRNAVAATPVPVLAIGGITVERARVCVDAGAAGVAGIGIFLPEGREPAALGLSRGVAELRAALIM